MKQFYYEAPFTELIEIQLEAASLVTASPGGTIEDAIGGYDDGWD